MGAWIRKQEKAYHDLVTSPGFIQSIKQPLKPKADCLEDSRGKGD